MKVDRELCIEVSNCDCPDGLQARQSKAVVLDPGSVGGYTLMEAARSCPENAVLLDDDEGNHLYP